MTKTRKQLVLVRVSKWKYYTLVMTRRCYTFYTLDCSTLTQTTRNLFSFEEEPWPLLPKTSLACPKNMGYVHEIVRCSQLFRIIPIPRPKNWNRIQTMEWLEKNPVHDERDIKFLTHEVLRVEDILIRKVREQQEVQQSGRGYWQGCVPCLRVIMCLTQDNVKSLFLTRANSRSRQKLDARNSKSR